MPLHGITLLCFGLSYAFALLFEVLQHFRPRPAQKLLAVGFGVAGLFAHTLFLFFHQPSPASPYGSLLLLAWVLAIFYLYGTVHHGRRAWAIFVLPLVIALVALAFPFANRSPNEPPPEPVAWFSGERFWGLVHGGLLLGASVGVCVGFVASVMYLIQARRLRMKKNPILGLRLLSLERLERMNRRAINLAFPLLTAGLLLGALLLDRLRAPAEDWATPKVLGTAGLWVLFALLMYLRYGVHLPGRRLALLTVVAFVLLLATLAATHPQMKSEILNPKSQTNPNHQIRMSETPKGRFWSLGFGIWSLFEISDFGFRISPPRGEAFGFLCGGDTR